MAGRIRSIKPEILEDERSAGLTSDAWRLWVSMWLLADDHGRLRGSAHWLTSQVFWSATPSRESRELLGELREARLIICYEVDGQSYIQIRNWTKHQKVDHPGKPRIPAPLEGPAQQTQPVAQDPRESLARVSDALASSGESLAPDLRSPIRTTLATATQPPLSLEAEKPKRQRKPKAEADPPPFALDDGLAELARSGRFVVTPMTKGARINAYAIVRQCPDISDWTLVGEWLRAGGEDWRKSIDSRNVTDVPAWIAHATKWAADGRRFAGKPAGRPEPAQRQYEDLGDMFARIGGES